MKRGLLIELANQTTGRIPPVKFFQQMADVVVVSEGLQRIRRTGQGGHKGRHVPKVSVVFVSEKVLTGLNHKLGKRNYQCQELSLVFNEAGQKPLSVEYLGEIFLARLRLFGQLKIRAYAHNFIHALLHVLGYNHEGQGVRYRHDEKIMTEIEHKSLKKLIKSGFLKKSGSYA